MTPSEIDVFFQISEHKCLTELAEQEAAHRAEQQHIKEKIQ